LNTRPSKGREGKKRRTGSDNHSKKKKEEEKGKERARRLHPGRPFIVLATRTFFCDWEVFNQAREYAEFTGEKEVK